MNRPDDNQWFELAVIRSLAIAGLRRKLNKTKGYHATKIRDAIYVHEQAVVRYANIVMEG